MPPPDDLERRVSAIEEQVRELTDRVRRSEHDAAAARVLAGGADRDVGEIGRDLRDFRQATMASFNAMREDIADLQRRFDGVDGWRAQVDRNFEQVDQNFAAVRARLDAAAAGQEVIVGLLNTLIERDS